MSATGKKMWITILIVLILSLAVWLVTGDEKSENAHDHAVHAERDAHLHDREADSPQKEKRKIKYWVAPMDPTYIRDKPGKSPMGMDLVPVYEDGSAEEDGRLIRIDPITVQNMGVRTSKVTREPLKTSIRTIGHVTYDEELVEHIHTKVSGWVEELFVKTTGEEIQKGGEVLSIYSPELVATEEEYLQALRYREKVADSPFEDVVRGAETLLQSTRRRLLLMDITEDEIRSLEEKGEVQREIILRSPTAGIVIKKHVFEGMRVTPGMELYTIADLSRVWVLASIYEYELPFLRVGQETVMSLPYEPGTVYHGRVTFIYPYLSPKTRTVQVRMEFENPHLKLKPDMFADVVISTRTPENVLLVPSEAVLRTGYRNMVITYLGDGRFLPKEVTVGPEGEGRIQILSGLDEGETIVTSGQFLIDSESNLREAINKMLEAGQPSPAATGKQPSPPMEHVDHEMHMHHEDMNMDEMKQESGHEYHDMQHENHEMHMNMDETQPESSHDHHDMKQENHEMHMHQDMDTHERPQESGREHHDMGEEKKRN